MSAKIYLSAPHMGGNELKYVQEAFASNWLSTVGPNLDQLEREFTGLVGQPAVALASGTAAMHLALRLVGVRDGDEVVTPTLTFAASCNPILYERAIPVLMDSEEQTWNLDPNLLADFLKTRAAANRLPKAVSVVHLFGQSADLDPILELCAKYELPLIEDAAEALGTKYKGKAPGGLGDVGIYSFNGNKIITGTSGGMLVSPRKDWVDKARYWSTQARDPGVNYLHSELGYNYRMSNVIAGIARGQLEILELRVQQRRAVFDRYAAPFKNLPGITPQPEASFGAGPGSSRHTRWLSCFVMDETKFGLTSFQLIKHLESLKIESRPVWKPMHTQKLYEGRECVGGAVAEYLNRRGICLPSSSSLAEETQRYIIDQIITAHRDAGRLREVYPATGL